MMDAASMPPTHEYHDNFVSARGASGSALSREIQSCLFDRLDWVEALHRDAMPDRSPMLLRAKWQEAEGWMPLMRSGHRRYEALANWYNFTWSPIFAHAHGEESRQALMQAMVRALPKFADRVTLKPLPNQDGLADALAYEFRKNGWHTRLTQCDINHYLPVGGRSFEEYWATRPGQLRSTVKRKSAKGVVKIRLERRFVADAWGDYETVYAQSWKPEEGSPQFVRHLAEREGAAGCLRMAVAYIDDRPVAAQFWTFENGIALIHKLAHTEDTVTFSPGSLLTHALMREVIDVDKAMEVDFGTGDDRYKRDWMEQSRPRFRIDALRPTAPANWPVMAKAMLYRLAGRDFAG